MFTRSLKRKLTVCDSILDSEQRNRDDSDFLEIQKDFIRLVRDSEGNRNHEMVTHLERSICGASSCGLHSHLEG